MNLDKIFEEIADGIKEIVKNGAKAFADEAEKDLRAFLKDSEEDLKRYSRMFADGAISKFEYQFLVKMKADGAEMLAVSAKGIAKARYKHLLESVRNLIVSSVMAALP
ncbi:MAG: hypothetical protein AAFU41_14665 [Pseudomonadota bacterium]